MSKSNHTSLFERIGGMPAVNAAVDIFYDKVISDSRINPFFRHIDLSKQSGKLKAFLAYAFGAPMKYNGKTLRHAHMHMHLQDAHFTAVTEHLVATLKQLKVANDLIDEVVMIALSTRDDVLNVRGHSYA